MIRYIFYYNQVFARTKLRYFAMQEEIDCCTIQPLRGIDVKQWDKIEWIHIFQLLVE
jgi:hypothetical protein